MAEAPSVIPDPLAFAPDGSALFEGVAGGVAVAGTVPVTVPGTVPVAVPGLVPEAE
jgi:hypothetical protein